MYIDRGIEATEWLRSFENGNSARIFTARVLIYLQSISEKGRRRASKQMRFSSGTGYEGKIRLECEKETAVRTFRSIVLRVTSTGRTEARVTIHHHILFLAELIY